MLGLDTLWRGITGKTAEQGGSFFGNLLTSPIDALAGFGRGVVGSLLSGAIATGVIFATKFFAPQLWHAVRSATGGKESVDAARKRVEEGGGLSVLADSAKLGFGIMGGIGGVKGLAESMVGRNGGLGTVFGAGATVVGIGAVLYHVLTKDEEAKPDASATPAAPKAVPAKANTAPTR
jgi:hypothetical protein